MLVQHFDSELRKAADGVNFGPLDGFGGRGGGQVFKNLPKPIQDIYDEWGLPRAILAGKNPGQEVRHYCEAMGIDVAKQIANI